MRDISGSDTDEEKSIGALFHQLVEDSKHYAKAEVDLGKARASAKLSQAKRPLLVAGAALAMGFATIVALVDFVWVAISSSVGPVLGGFITFLLFAAVTALLVRYAARALGNLR